MKRLYSPFVNLALGLTMCISSCDAYKADIASSEYRITYVSAHCVKVTVSAHIPNDSRSGYVGVLINIANLTSGADKIDTYVTSSEGSGEYDLTIHGLQELLSYDICSYVQSGRTAIPTYSEKSIFTTTMVPFSIKNHTCVDLGLPSGVLWATCNVGAQVQTGAGNYYSAQDCAGTDIATSNWGGAWRIPTAADWNELMNPGYCSHVWTTINGVKGYKFQGIKTGYTNQSIFLPASGSKSFPGNVYGYYWNSEGKGISFYSNDLGLSEFSHGDWAIPVRPVAD